MQLKVRYRLAFLFLCIFIIYSFISKIEFSVFDFDITNSLDSSTEDDDFLSPRTHFLMPAHLKGKALPFHRIYESREIGFSYYEKKNDSTDDKISVTKLILLWTPWNSVRKTINYYSLRPGIKSFTRYRCPNSNCFAAYDRSQLSNADAVLFHLLDTNSNDMPTERNWMQLWIVYNMEPPWLVQRHHAHLPVLNNLFNLSMSYREDSDIVARYGFMDLKKNTIIDVNSHQLFLKKEHSVVWFVSDCVTDSRREDYVQELRKYIDVDVYGTCGDNKCFPAQSSVCYDEILAKYKFYLSFENAICKDYVTEKFFNVFNHDIIPVVYGGADYSRIAPPGSYIDANKYPKPHTLANVLKQIGNNETLYCEFLRRKSSHVAVLDPWMCKLCDRLHAPHVSSTLVDVKAWWIDEAHCQRWTKNEGYFQL